MLDNRLLTFIALSKIKNFTKTAEYLNITQPAVSQHIRYLEEFYQADLIVRDKRNIRLTAEGELLLKYANKVYFLSKEIEKTLHNRTGIIKKYSIGATLTIGEYILPRILGVYKQTYPNIDISMDVDNTNTILKKLDNQEIDLGLVEGPFNRQKYSHHLFSKDRLILVVSPKHRLANRKMVDLDELLEEKFILREQGSGTRMIFENELYKKGYTLKDFNLHMQIGNLNAIISLVISNLGITVISQEVVKNEIKNKTLCAIPIKGMDLEREFYFLYLHHCPAKDFIQHFIDFCMHHVDTIKHKKHP